MRVYKNCFQTARTVHIMCEIDSDLCITSYSKTCRVKIMHAIQLSEVVSDPVSFADARSLDAQVICLIV